MISVVVPIYNCEEYLADCIESILNQSYTDFQLILVDDGSTDNSALICKAYQAMDKRIKYVFQKNSGVSSARNLGISLTRGEYLTFVDADDLLRPTALEIALEYFQRTNADMVTYGWSRFYEDGGQNEEVKPLFEVIDSKDTYLRRVLSNYSDCGGGYPWNKIWKVSSLQSSVPLYRPELYYFEDLEWVIRTSLQMEKIVVCPEVLYEYRVRDNSATNIIDQIERREIGYHKSILYVLEDISGYQQIYDWFVLKYAAEIVNGIFGAIKNGYKQLKKELMLIFKKYNKAIRKACYSNKKMFVRYILIRLFL